MDTQPPHTPPLLLAIDPGKDKCGLALLRHPSRSQLQPLVDILSFVLHRQIVPRAETVAFIQNLLVRHEIQTVVLGHATTAASLRHELECALPSLVVEEQDETGSTLAARELYWIAHPPRGWRRVLPLSLQVPPVPLDDLAAVVLAARFLERTNAA